MKKAVFLDRDGVIIKEGEIVKELSDLVILDKVPEAIKILNDNGFIIIGITNQPNIARGLITKKEVENVNLGLIKKIYEKSGGVIHKFYYCPHHPNADIDMYRKVCECRKPEPGMLKKAKKEFGINMKKSFMIGDMLSDITAGKKVGCKTILINSEYNFKIIETGRKFEPLNPDYRADNLYNALEIILK